MRLHHNWGTNGLVPSWVSCNILLCKRISSNIMASHQCTASAHFNRNLTLTVLGFGLEITLSSKLHPFLLKTASLHFGHIIFLSCHIMCPFHCSVKVPESSSLGLAWPSICSRMGVSWQPIPCTGVGPLLSVWLLLTVCHVYGGGVGLTSCL